MRTRNEKGQYQTIEEVVTVSEKFQKFTLQKNCGSNIFGIFNFKNALDLNKLESDRQNIVRKIEDVQKLSAQIAWLQEKGIEIERARKDLAYKTAYSTAQIGVLDNNPIANLVKLKISREVFQPLPPEGRLILILDRLTTCLTEIDNRIEYLNSPA